MNLIYILSMNVFTYRKNKLSFFVYVPSDKIKLTSIKYLDKVKDGEPKKFHQQRSKKRSVSSN